MVNTINMVETHLITKPVEHKWKQFKFNLRLSDEDERNQKPGTLTAPREGMGRKNLDFILPAISKPTEGNCGKEGKKERCRDVFHPWSYSWTRLNCNGSPFRVNLKTLVLIGVSFASSLMTLSELLFFLPFFHPQQHHRLHHRTKLSASSALLNKCRYIKEVDAKSYGHNSGTGRIQGRETTPRLTDAHSMLIR